MKKVPFGSEIILCLVKTTKSAKGRQLPFDLELCRGNENRRQCPKFAGDSRQPVAILNPSSWYYSHVLVSLM